MRAYCTRRLSMILGWASGSAVTLPLQPNHKPPWVWNASRTATARPPAAPLPVGSGAATRFETTTRRGKRLLRCTPPRSVADAKGVGQIGQQRRSVRCQHLVPAAVAKAQEQATACSRAMLSSRARPDPSKGANDRWRNFVAAFKGDELSVRRPRLGCRTLGELRRSRRAGWDVAPSQECERPASLHFRSRSLCRSSRRSAAARCSGFHMRHLSPTQVPHKES